jgi:DNA-binding NtrC family response regulator
MMPTTSCPPVQGGGGVRSAATILLVEDEASVRNVLNRYLTAQGFRVLVADSARTAFSAWSKNSESVDVLLTDIMLPGGMTGCELAKALQKEKKSLSVILSSGYNTDLTEGATADSFQRQFIAKPYRPEQLLELVRRALPEVGCK